MKTKNTPELSIKNINKDRELFRRIAEGEYTALEELFGKYYNSLCRFGLSYEQNIAIVEEKISDVFILIWKKRRELKNIEKPKPYIYVIAKNSLKKKLKNNYLLQSIDDGTGECVAFTPSIEEILIDEEEREITSHQIRSILDSIPNQSRRIFELSRVDGFKYSEISEIVNISPRTVENHIALAMKYISKGLKHQIN